MLYLISQYGTGISVGLIEAQGAQEDINLAHNLFNRNANYSLFHGAINFDSLRQFRKFLIYKEYFRLTSERATKIKFGQKIPLNTFNLLKRATKSARLILESNVRHENFMRNIALNTSSNNIGFYQDELGEE